jgi:hypothetical protein
LKKALATILFFINLVLLNSLNFRGIEKWIINFPEGNAAILDYSISNCVIEDTGVLLELKKGKTSLRVTVIKQIKMDDLIKNITTIENNILSENKLQTTNINIKIKEAEISFGLKEDIVITLKIDVFRFKLNNRTILELSNKITVDPVFNYRTGTNRFIYTFMFKDINLKKGIKDTFPGWQEFINILIRWFQNGINTNNQEIIALVYETKVMNIMEKEEEKKVVLSKNERSNNWFGFNLDYFVPNFVSGEPDGIYLNHFSYHVFQPMFNFSFRSVGKKEWLTKPFQFTIFAGGYLEVNASFSIRKTKGEFEGYTSRNGSFVVAGGVAFGFGFSAMVPLFVQEKYKGDLFGIGIEAITAINIPYFFKDYYYEYFLTQYINFVIHLVPYSRVRSDIVIGFNMSFVNGNFDETSNNAFMNKFGLTIGARLKVDIFNFYKSVNMYK